LFNSVEMKFMQKIIDMLTLIKKNIQATMNHLNAKKVIKLPNALHGKLVRKDSDKRLKHVGRTTSCNNINHIEKQDKNIRTSGR